LHLLITIVLIDIKLFSRGREGKVVWVSKEKAAENRARILTEAARLFREHGLSGVGVDALTGAAGLTHGSLYRQFGSKERLAAAAFSHALNTSSARMSDVGALYDYVTHYLSQDHRKGRRSGIVRPHTGRRADTIDVALAAASSLIS
jgi:AcrR family transcriptional regulator